ncbi:MAG: ribbon-helix-helix domain-containing protein [Cyanobacteria bacterium P01_G01_bin.4]
MARKPGKLAAAAGVEAPATPAEVAPQAVVEPKPAAAAPTPAKTKQRGRGNKHIGGYFSEETLTQLKVLGAYEGKTQQELIQEALNGLFEKYGKPPIA